MSYQPNLFIRNIGNVCANKVYELVSNYQFGKISNIEIFRKKRETNAVIKMEQWDTRHTECTRILLSQGKPIYLYHTDDDYWRVYAYNDELEQRRNEKAMLRKKRENEKKQKALLLKQQQKDEERALEYELAQIAEECRKQEELDECQRQIKEQWREVNEEYQRNDVILDYGDIVNYKGDTKASRKLQKLLLNKKMKK
jgi:hypothetical protein